MRMDIINSIARMLEGFVNESILVRAQKKDWQKYTFCQSAWLRWTNGAGVDDYPYDLVEWWCNANPSTGALPNWKRKGDYDEVIFVTDGESSLTNMLQRPCHWKATSSFCCDITKAWTSACATISSQHTRNINGSMCSRWELAASCDGGCNHPSCSGRHHETRAHLSDCFQDDMLLAPLYTYTSSRIIKGWKAARHPVKREWSKIRLGNWN